MLCWCGRRRLIEAAVATSSLFLILPSSSSSSAASSFPLDDYTATLRKVHPPRPDWYEELYASALLSTGMQFYEREVTKWKAVQVLDIGIGTGPNLKYYGADSGVVRVFGVDPNESNFEFIQAVGEAIPLGDASVDAVVDRTQQEIKRVLRPGGLYLLWSMWLQKMGQPSELYRMFLILADGCLISPEKPGRTYPNRSSQASSLT